MKPIRTTLQGFGPHSDTTVEWHRLESPVGIVGESEAGKTWLLEGPFAALHGQFVFYGSIYDSLTLGGTGKGRIVYVFEHGGRFLKAERIVSKTGRTKSHKAMLWEAETEADAIADRFGPKPIAGPKLGDFKEKIVAMIGDAKLAKATWFLSQDHSGDMCGTQETESLAQYRRDVLSATMLDLGSIKKILNRAADKRKTTRARAKELEAQLVGEDDPARLIVEKQEEIDVVAHSLLAAKSDLDVAEGLLESARTRLRDAESDDSVLQAQIDAYENAVTVRDAAQARLEALTEEAKALEKRAAGLEDAKKDVGMVASLKKQRVELRANQEHHEAWLTWSGGKETRNQALLSAEELVRSMESVPGADEETVALAGRLEEISAEYTNAEASNKRAETRNAELQELRTAIQSAIASFKDRLGGVNSRLASMPAVLFGDDCSPCPLMREWQALPVEKKDLEDMALIKSGDLAAVPADIPLIDLAPIITNGAQARSASNAVSNAREATEKLEGFRDKAQAAKKDFDGHMLMEPHRPGDRSGELRSTQNDIEEFSGAEERVKACEQAVKDADTKRGEMHVELRAGVNAKWKIADTARAAESARDALKDREAQRASVREEVHARDQTAKEANKAHERLISEAATLRAELEGLKRRQEEQANKRARLAALLDDVAGYEDLCDCFGPKGVRQNLVDQATPILERYADELFDKATVGKMRMRIATQSELDDGSIVEDFAIMVKDHRGERDAINFCGGEQQEIRIVLRAATAMAAAKVKGGMPGFMALDEAFASMGAEKKEEGIRILDHIGTMTETLHVVTHSAEIAARMRSWVWLTQRYDGVRVETSAGGAS